MGGSHISDRSGHSAPSTPPPPYRDSTSPLATSTKRPDILRLSTPPSTPPTHDLSLAPMQPTTRHMDLQPYQPPAPPQPHIHGAGQRLLSLQEIKDMPFDELWSRTHVPPPAIPSFTRHSPMQLPSQPEHGRRKQLTAGPGGNY